MNHIETQRLILRHFTEEDINALFSILSDKDVNTFLPMFPLKDRGSKRLSPIYKKLDSAERILLCYLYENKQCTHWLYPYKRR